MKKMPGGIFFYGEGGWTFQIKALYSIIHQKYHFVKASASQGFLKGNMHRLKISKKQSKEVE